MGSTHLYVVDSSRFDFSFGYPLQDDLSTGLISMQYGIDQRVNNNDVETDLGVAIHMINNSELPYARNVPLRTLISQMIEDIPGVDIFRTFPVLDPWHLSNDVNKAIAAYMYTMLTGDCALEGSLPPIDSVEWRTMMSHRIGYTTAWNLMHMQGVNPCYDSVLTISNDSTWHCYLTTGCQWAGSNPSFPGQYNSLSDCQAACNSTTINNIDGNKPKTLIKVIDILGRETKHLKNQPLFYIYDDGTVEKNLIIE